MLDAHIAGSKVGRNGAFSDSPFAVAFIFFMLWTVVASAIMTRRAGAARQKEAAPSAGEPAGVG